MDILQSTVLHRKGKKWKSRWVVFRKSTAVPDPCEASMLILYKDQNHRHHKQVLPLWKFAGCLTSPKADKAENVLMIFTENTTTALAFDTPTLLNDWYQAICTQIGKEVKYPIVVPPKQKLKPGDGTLFIYSTFFSIVNDKSCRCVARWSAQDLCNCASIDGDFLFEINRSRNWKGHTYRLKSRNVDEIVQTLDYIKGNHSSGMNDSFRDRSDTVPELKVDMKRERRYTLDSLPEQSFFQRALLRVSNRFRKHHRSRAATMGSQKHVRQQPQLQSQAASSASFKGNGSELIGVGSQDVFKRDVQLLSDMNKNASGAAFQGRSNSHGNFSTEFGCPGRSKAQSKSEIVQRTTSPSQATTDSVIVGNKQVNTNVTNPGRQPHSVGSASMVSSRSRGLSSTTSDVFTDDTNESECKTRQNGPPIAPPRSPVSLGIFSFPDMPDGGEADGDSDYLNKEGIDKLTGRSAGGTSTDASEVVLRRKAGNVSLLDEIDYEIKRRTREEDMPSTPLSHTSLDGPRSFDFYDHEEGENYVMLRTTDAGPAVDTTDADTQIPSRKQSSEVCRKQSTSKDQIFNERSASAVNYNADRIAEQELNFDPGVHSPDRVKDGKEEATYQNITEVLMEQREFLAAAGRRNSSRRSSSKHLSDPLLERLGNAQQIHNGGVASSLHELPHETAYINYQGQNDTRGKPSSYVNVNVVGASARNNRKKKPSPLNIDFGKYDDDENIYHVVSSLVTDRSGSSDGLGSYRNISGGAYVNDSGRSSSRDRAYVNVPSQKTVPMLNYVLVSGGKGSSSHSYRSERSASLNSVQSDKSDKVPYSYIDEKATSLLQRTREQHWQRRAEDGQANLNTPKKTKKSFGD